MVINNALRVNDQTCGEASQLVEWVNVVGNKGEYGVLAMYDLGTSCTVIDTGTAERYALQMERVEFTVSTVTGSQKGSTLYTFLVRNEANELIKVQALGVTIKQFFAAARIPVREAWGPYFGRPYQISHGGGLGLLLGSDQSKLHPRQISFAGKEVLWKSGLSGDYLITGGEREQGLQTINKISVSLSPNALKKVNLGTKVTNSRVEEGKIITVVEDMKEKVFRQLTGLDSVLVTPCSACEICRSQTDRMAEQDLLEYDALRRTVSFCKEEGRYRGDFLYIEEKVREVKDNSDFAKKSSESLHRKLLRLPAQSIKDFDDALETAKEMGALRRTTDVEGINDGNPRRYIPINFAFSGKESSTKIRPTFNCGWSRGTCDPSFNDIHLVGPRNLNNLDQSMLFFKTNAVVGLIDIKKFFWTCRVSTRTASLNRIWLPEGGYSKAKKGELNLEEWCWVTLTFGQTGAPALSGVIRHQAADDFCQYEEVRRQVKEKALVDDIIIGASTKETFITYQKDVEQMLEKSGMKFHDWVASCSGSGAEIDFNQTPIKEGLKVFGYTYDQGKDCFTLRVTINITQATRGKKFQEGLEMGGDPNKYISEHQFTKRKALGVTMSLWDLTGWVLPIQMLLRLLYRELLEENKNLSWDEELPEAFKGKYANTFKKLQSFDGLTWDRAVIPTSDWDEEWGCRLATFFDGSEVASTAYTYLVTRKNDGSFHSRLLWAKGKLGCGSVPRNELGAAFLAVKMNNFLERYLQQRIRDITYFGDSQVVLYQIASRSILYDAWARARLRAIQQGSRGASWLYIPAKENVADIGSKNSPRINRGAMESDFYQRGNFLEDENWKGIRLGAPEASTLANLPGIKKIYKTSPVTLLNAIQVSGPEMEKEDQEELEGCKESENIDMDLTKVSAATLDIVSNNLLGKYKKTARATKINQNAEKDRLPDFLRNAAKQLPGGEGTEAFSQLLLKHRDLDKVRRILALALRWRYGRYTNLQEKVDKALTSHAAPGTVQYLCKKGVSFGPLRLDESNRVWSKNRPFLGEEVQKILPEETMVLAPTTDLARLIARSYHDSNHDLASSSVQSMVRKDMNVRIPNLVRMLEQERSQCTTCRHHQRIPYKPVEAGVPLQRHNLKGKPFTAVCIDGIGPFKVRALHLQDRRTAKVWALLAVDQPTGLAHISILMDSSTYAVQVALQDLETEWNVEVDLITLDPATSFVGLQEEYVIEDSDTSEPIDIAKRVTEAGYNLKLSPAKASWFQALCEKRVDFIKTALYFHPRRILHVVELQLILKKIILELNNRPVLLRQTQDDFVSLSRMDLLGKFYHGPRDTTFRSTKDLLKDIELVEECAEEAKRVFNEIYTEQLRDYSKWKYPGEMPELHDIVGVPDKEVHGGPRMGKIVEVRSPHSVVVEIARPRRGHPFPVEKVTTQKVRFERSPRSLYLVERAGKEVETVDMRRVEAGSKFSENLNASEITLDGLLDELPPALPVGGSVEQAKESNAPEAIVPPTERRGEEEEDDLTSNTTSSPPCPGVPSAMIDAPEEKEEEEDNPEDVVDSAPQPETPSEKGDLNHASASNEGALSAKPPPSNTEGGKTELVSMLMPDLPCIVVEAPEGEEMEEDREVGRGASKGGTTVDSADTNEDGPCGTETMELGRGKRHKYPRTVYTH